MPIQLLLALFIKFVLGENAITRINNANEFIEFSNSVDRRTSYSGTTVYLDSDLSLLGKTIEPIGRSNYFLGVFDGQGHTISDLKMNSSLQYTGLFRYSNGLTIRNIVLDSSCSVTCNFTGNVSIRVGGLIGECYADYGQCNIENSVNMADVTFSGNTTGGSGYLYLGGIAGYLSPSPKYPVYVKNCVNYGSVIQSGIVSYNSYIGGIVGNLYGSSDSSYKHVYNCLNYGTITHNGTSLSVLHIRGIVGYSSHVYIENYVNAGEISTPTKPSESYIGGIVGYVYSGSNITHCYYTSGVRIGKVREDIEPIPAITETPNFTSNINSTLIANLNKYATNKGWNKWLFNVNNASISFIINLGKGLTINSQIILFPDLANSSERNFSGWYTDANLTTLFNSSHVESNTSLYGMFCGSSNYTVTLDANGGNELGESESEMIVGCMDYYGPFPTPTKDGHTLTGWFTERERGGNKVEMGDKVKTLNNHTLYAHWATNNYTMTFDFDNGTIVNKIFSYNASVEYPKNESMEREGYILNGWNETVIHMPAHNITITALWIKNNYTVTFDVNGGNDFSETLMTVTFDSPYGPLPIPIKEGHMFVGWFTDNNVSEVTNETRVSIADNHTLHAYWEEVTTQVEIIFNTKDLSREDVEEIVKKYTDAEFTIIDFEEESGEIKVIIKFTDNEEAVEFVRNIIELSRDNDSNMIKRVGFVLGSGVSFSSILYPKLLTFLL